MHGFLLGVVKKLWTVWTESTGQAYCLSKEKVHKAKRYCTESFEYQKPRCFLFVDR